MRGLGEAMLTQFGYNVIAAANGRDALAVYKDNKESISLVILDLIMPEMDGKACLKEILQPAPHAKVLIATGYSDAQILNDISVLGAKGFVEKPYTPRVLLRTVSEILDVN